MSAIFQFIVILNALFFLFYGFQSLTSQWMIEEFKRFGLRDNERKLTGFLQISGSLGLLAGFMFPYIGLFAAAGFTIMMLVAFIVRIKIKDSLVQSLPSLFFMLFNIWVMFGFYKIWH
ncbi:MAG: DoxX family protein [Gracilimonas sp.]|nr:DoxX family protein [Gracilimonas sp.]